ncbi:conserved hypothetical protein [Formosa agariphila KMM 3901]|uniref:Uncharacterized protein n=1 Tax=Formosa agariphila (strain DSM 15362 / KCTC 12365 / LMG 23005 / KMM 3901 / M-2Alg 35-1) TaxID=1347342 RepID=T2KKN6_FORAG|nr:conserved hypothetical protein [Formosa agariphila KMM 3901]
MSVFGLVLLLLLLPCKVRNFVQAELGVPQTKVLNKSQSTISQSNCQTFEFSETIQSTTKPSVQQPDVLISEAFHFDLTSYLFKHAFKLQTSRNQEVSDVPLYILYQNLKVYS